MTSAAEVDRVWHTAAVAMMRTIQFYVTIVVVTLPVVLIGAAAVDGPWRNALMALPNLGALAVIRLLVIRPMLRIAEANAAAQLARLSVAERDEVVETLAKIGRHWP